MEKHIHRAVLHNENSGRQSHDESIRIRGREHFSCFMKENWKETSAIGLKIKWCRRFSGCLGSGTTMTTLGIRNDFNQEEPGKEKEKEDKGKEKDDKPSRTNEKEKERTTLQEMRVIGLKITGKEQRQKVGMMAIGPMKMRQRGNPKAARLG